MHHRDSEDRIMEALGSLTAGQAQIQESLKHVAAATEDHEKRLRFLEKSFRMAAGAFVAIQVAFGAWLKLGKGV